MKTPRVTIAGLRGGSGKTTLSVGLAAALRERGMKVVAFKKGPDYIDAGWLAKATGRPCFNLDPYLIGEDRLLGSFIGHSAGADIAIVEGNRGLFDGMDAVGSFSTSKVSRALKAPVILIVDCTKTTRTTAAVLAGVEHFERGLSIGGVVLNNIAGARHEAVTREAIERYTGLKVLGAIPRLREMHFPERHMGLTPSQEHPEVDAAIRRAAMVIKEHVEVGRVLEVASKAPGLAMPKVDIAPTPSAKARVKVGVIRDSAFQFYYEENFEALSARGAELVEVSALKEGELPEMDALYIGGGFPETHAIALARNLSFKKSLQKAIEGGLPVYAECGGLMYLGESLVLENRQYPMAGVFPLRFTLHQRPQAHGYTAVKVKGKNPFYRAGVELKGHEFHYSKAEARGGHLSFAFSMQRGEGILDGKDGVCYKNAFATYTHLHALGSPEWADGVVRAALAFRRER